GRGALERPRGGVLTRADRDRADEREPPALAQLRGPAASRARDGGAEARFLGSYEQGHGRGAPDLRPRGALLQRARAAHRRAAGSGRRALRGASWLGCTLPCSPMRRSPSASGSTSPPPSARRWCHSCSPASSSATASACLPSTALSASASPAAWTTGWPIAAL